jgi:hypothetical protein
LFSYLGRLEQDDVIFADTPWVGTGRLDKVDKSYR